QRAAGDAAERAVREVEAARSRSQPGCPSQKPSNDAPFNHDADRSSKRFVNPSIVSDFCIGASKEWSCRLPTLARIWPVVFNLLPRLQAVDQLPVLAPAEIDPRAGQHAERG